MEIRDGPYTVYAQIFPNGKMYVGITSKDPKKRWNNGNGYRQNTFIWRAIKKYGWANVEKEIIASHLTMEEATNFERLLIDKLDLMNPDKGYNLTSGGEMVPGYCYSEATRKKQSEKRKGLQSGVNNARSIPVVCVETGEIFPCMSKASLSVSTNVNSVSDCLRGKSKTAGGYHWRFANDDEKPERPPKKPPPSPNKGKTRPDIRGGLNWCAKPVHCVELNQDFGCIRDAAKATGANTDGIRFCCEGKGHVSGGYHWEYIKKEGTNENDSIAESKKSGK